MHAGTCFNVHGNSKDQPLLLPQPVLCLKTMVLPLELVTLWATQLWRNPFCKLLRMLSMTASAMGAWTKLYQLLMLLMTMKLAGLALTHLIRLQWGWRLLKLLEACHQKGQCKPSYQSRPHCLSVTLSVEHRFLSMSLKSTHSSCPQTSRRMLSLRGPRTPTLISQPPQQLRTRQLRTLMGRLTTQGECKRPL
jgi:hypothetical protein